MKIHVPRHIIAETKVAAFEKPRAEVEKFPGGSRDLHIDLEPLEIGDIEDLKSAAEGLKETRFLRALNALHDPAKSNWKVPNFKAFLPVLRDYLEENCRQGWLWERQKDGTMLPWAITSAKMIFPDNRYFSSPFVRVSGQAYSKSDDDTMKVVGRNWDFEAGDASRSTVEKILEKVGLFPENEAFELAHEAAVERWCGAVETGFSELFRVTGDVFKYADSTRGRDTGEPIGRKVIFDLDRKSLMNSPNETESSAFGRENNGIPVTNPIHPLARVFDLATHEFYWISTEHLKRYEYDLSLGKKIVLPDSHRDLLDILTKDISVFTSDFIDGKSSGNLILAKGEPGLGKTLTAEVYAEMMERPLYSVHAGVLGTDPGSIEKRLREVFVKARRWNCVLLLDEADVFVMQRGNDIQLNAIVAEFLRALEHFDGLIFMTTNRPGDIDEAVISRCLAIIHYDRPTPDDAKKIWANISANFGAPLSPQLIEQLVQDWPQATGRDINRLLSLVMRIAKSEKREIDRDMIRRMAIFRGMSSR